MNSVGAAPLKIAYALGIGIGITVAIASAASLWYFNRKSQSIPPPTKWRRVGTIVKINIYPVKSCGALKLNGDEQISCDRLGLSLQGCQDRTLMLINEDGNMITAHKFPRLELIASELVGLTQIKFTASARPELVLDLATLQSKESIEIRTAVGSTKIKVHLCGQEYDEWFSKVVLRQGFGLRLVHYPMNKPVKEINARMLKTPHITNDDREVNAASYVLINLASVDELRRKLPRNEAFRGSFELKMDEHEPFAEDNWDWVKMGNNVIFSKVAPCSRRIFPKVEAEIEETPETFLESALKSLRSFEGYPSPIFGMHLGICKSGTIKVNDVVYVEGY